MGSSTAGDAAAGGLPAAAAAAVVVAVVVGRASSVAFGGASSPGVAALGLTDVLCGDRFTVPRDGGCSVKNNNTESHPQRHTGRVTQGAS